LARKEWQKVWRSDCTISAARILEVSRLEGLATPGSLVIADATRHQLGQLFDLRDLGPQPLAGFAEPQRAWRVLGEGGTVSRFEALRSVATPLVGRDEELDLLRRRWDQAKTSEGRVVLISGEPGIGKSRLAAAIYEATEGEPRTRLRWFCSPHHQDSALHPTIVQLESTAGFARDDDGEAKRAKLRELLHDADADEFELIAERLSLPNAVTDLNLSPQRKRERLFEALLNEMDALSRCCGCQLLHLLRLEPRRVRTVTDLKEMKQAQTDSPALPDTAGGVVR
jgi:AAA ATPase domain